jgi:hypothetical protein
MPPFTISAAWRFMARLPRHHFFLGHCRLRSTRGNRVGERKLRARPETSVTNQTGYMGDTFWPFLFFFI